LYFVLCALYFVLCTLCFEVPLQILEGKLVAGILSKEDLKAPRTKL
jgi:hypothetical protein